MLDRTVVVAALLVFAACSSMPGQRPVSEPAPTPAPASEAKPAPPPAVAEGSSNPVEEVPLKVELTDQTTTGRVMKLRAKITNPHPEEVKGVRVQLVFVAPAGDDQVKVLEIQQKEMVTTLEPGGSDMLRWDVESVYMGHFFIAAYPKTLGGKAMPPPDHWTE